MTLRVTLTCGRCGFKWQDEVDVSRYDLWQGFSLRRVCPRCHVPNRFSGGGDGLIAAMTTTTLTNYSMMGTVDVNYSVNDRFEPPNANFA